MSAEIFARKGDVYAGGLTWATVDVPSQWRAECERKAPVDCDLVILWRAAPGQYQLGFAESGGGLHAGGLALAAVLSLALGNDWAGVFEIPSVAVGAEPTYAFVAVADGGAVLRDAVGSAGIIKDELTAYLDELQQYQAEVGAIYAPEPMGVPGAQPSPTMDTLLAKAGGGRAGLLARIPQLAAIPAVQRYALRGARLQNARRSRSASGPTKSGGRVRPGHSRGNVLKVSAAVAMVLGIGGQLWWSHHQQALIDREQAEKIRQKQQAAAQQQEEAARQREAAHHELKHVQVVMPPPWSTQPTVSAMVEACSRAMAPIPLALGGWEMHTVTCVNGDFTAVYQRTKTATAADFIAAARSLMGATPTISNGNNTGTVVVQFKGADSSDEALAVSGAPETELLSHFQALDDPLPTLVPIADPVGPDPKNPPPPPAWRGYSFTLKTATTPINTTRHPSLLLGGLNIPGLRVASLSAERTDAPPHLTWTIEGSLYVPR